MVVLLEAVDGDNAPTSAAGPALSPKKAKRPTYQAAQAALMDYLEKQGWTLSRGLSVPHATSSDNTRRLWFKSQAVWFTADDGSLSAKNVKNFKLARSLHGDIRAVTPEQFMADAEKLMKHAASDPNW
jgi:hypothetical protein